MLAHQLGCTKPDAIGGFSPIFKGVYKVSKTSWDIFR